MIRAFAAVFAATMTLLFFVSAAAHGFSIGGGRPSRTLGKFMAGQSS